MAKVSKKVVLKDARLSFPSLFETEEYKGVDTGKYAASFLIDKSATQGKELAALVKEVAEQAFGSPVPKKVEYCIKDGDDTEYDGYEGMWAIKANTKKRPILVDRNKSPVTEDDDVLYAGCYVNASLEVYSLDNQYGKRVGCQLNGIQFVRDGDSFGARNDSLDDFDAIDGGSDDEDSPF